jgi:dipeptidase E
MKYYLSSFKMGKKTKKLKRMLPANKRTAYIPNALDYSDDLERRKKSDKQNMAQLRAVGLKPEILDLRQYFGRTKRLEKKLSKFGVIWIRGGNTFVLRQAMRLSGFDKIFKKLRKKKDMLYGGIAPEFASWLLACMVSS